MTERELRIWAEAHAPAGSPQAAAVLSLLAERDALRRQVTGHADRSECVGRPAALPGPEPADLIRLADDGCPHAGGTA